MQKTILMIMAVVIVVGCGESVVDIGGENVDVGGRSTENANNQPEQTKEPPANLRKELKPEDVVGSYEAGLGDLIFRFVLLESGVVENYFNGIKEPEDAKWKIRGAEVHIEKGKSDGTVIVNKIEPNGDLTVFARIRNGKREDFQKGTYRKIKSPKATPSKSVEIADPIVEEVIRRELNKPTGVLTEADLEKVEVLPLTLTELSDTGLKEVAKLKKLKYLGVGVTQVTDAGLKELVEMKQLISLNLYSTQITDKGLREVGELKQLNKLHLKNTKITDAGLKELVQMKQLKLLSLQFTEVTKVGVAELQKALPKCKIESDFED